MPLTEAGMLMVIQLYSVADETICEHSSVVFEIPILPFLRQVKFEPPCLVFSGSAARVGFECCKSACLQISIQMVRLDFGHIHRKE